MKKIAFLLLVLGSETVSYGNAGTRAIGKFLRFGALRRAACVSAGIGTAILTNNAHACQCTTRNYTHIEPIRITDLSSLADDKTRERVADFKKVCAEAQAQLRQWAGAIVAPQVQSVLQAILMGTERPSAIQQEPHPNIFDQLDQDLVQINHALAIAENAAQNFQNAMLNTHNIPPAHLPIPTHILPPAAPAA